MLAIISPAKTLDFTTAPVPSFQFTEPQFTDYSALNLLIFVGNFPRLQIASLMSISDKLAGLNAVRFNEWSPQHNLGNSRAALFAFKGDVYTSLDVRDSFHGRYSIFTISSKNVIGGYMVLLAPLDLMQPIVSEMGTKLENPQGKDLYAFWGMLLLMHCKNR